MKRVLLAFILVLNSYNIGTVKYNVIDNISENGVSTEEVQSIFSNEVIDGEKTNEEVVVINSINNTQTIPERKNNTPKVVPEVKEFQIIDGIGKAKGNISIENLNLLNSELNKLPKSLLNTFVNSGWNIYVTDEDINNNYFGGRFYKVQGATVYTEKNILITNTEKSIKEATIHEFGHFVDYNFDVTSDDEEFHRIYNEEIYEFMGRISNTECVSNEKEYFAESFYYMYIDSSKVMPQTYNYLSNIINQL